ncbi:MAG: sulfate reduction electron transfer complex DsrMKJOP subunit DsrO [bacterium]
MDSGKRNFLKIAGLTAVGGYVGVRAVGAIAAGPQKAKQTLALVIDTRKCKGDCPDCITACHREHNVPERHNPNFKPPGPSAKQAIKWIWVDTFAGAFHEQIHQRTGRRKDPLLVLCNHCDDPPCTRVCPTKATWKREQDGIITIDMHRCIGCRFCMAACPYGSRSFNFHDPRKSLKSVTPGFPTRTLGVVEKCNFCEERLERGLQPACVEACEKKAMSFGDLNDDKSPASVALKGNFTITRKPHLGTGPEVYYIL